MSKWEWPWLLQNHTVVVLTPAIFLSVLDSGAASFGDIRLLVRPGAAADVRADGRREAGAGGLSAAAWPPALLRRT